MIQPGTLDLRAPRHVPFTYQIDFEGQNFTGATGAAQVRLYPDATGNPLATFGAAFAQVTVDALPIATVTLTLSQAVIEALPQSGEAGDDAEFAWDLQITVGGAKSLWLRGSFTVEAGVTR